MADLSDVQSALVSLIAGFVYPNGAGQASVTGGPVKVYPGWPIAACLDSDMAASPPVTNVSVYPAQMNRNTTRYMEGEEQVSIQTPTLTLTVSGQTITVAGTIPAAGNPHVLCAFVNGTPYPVPVTSADTLTSAASKLATAIATDFPGTTSSAAVITVASTGRIGAVRIGITGTTALVTRNQEQVFQIGIWAADPATRDTVAKSIDVALSKILRFALPDTSLCRLIWKNSLQSDKWQKQTLYRRDLFYTCEYATVDIEAATQITQIQENNSAAVAGVAPVRPLGTVYT